MRSFFHYRRKYAHLINVDTGRRIGIICRFAEYPSRAHIVYYMRIELYPRRFVLR